MSTPKISFKVPGAAESEGVATGDGVVTHELANAPGKEREKEPLYGGDITNVSEGMNLDLPAGRLHTCRDCLL